MPGPGTCSFIHIDVSDEDSVKNAFYLALEELKTLDVLAHPAAIQGPADASSVKVEDWDNMFAVNVRGTMLTNQNAFKYMKKNSGKIFESIQVDSVTNHYYVEIPEWVVNDFGWYEDTEIELNLEGKEILIKEREDD